MNIEKLKKELEHKFELMYEDGIKHTIHMTKKGNDFITNIVLKDKEKPLNDLQITARFIRKKKS